MASAFVHELTDGNFDAEVLQSPVPYLVDFWAPWCGPCRMVAPIIDELATEYNGKLKVGKVNVDDHQEVAARYGIASIPTLMIFKNGQLVERIVGALPKPMLKQVIDKHV
ncbi:MAG: thioredoxin [Candidatus Hydrogenedentota bacterium]|jgi:thioredoxin 1|uniref:Thioredoxin n=1 Tax=Sumerlaea chitinivorans TaxID=2250252 RepID=A0A2Z4Y5T6_SUMC1|nr:Thioredoxin [Candidatus Sumerlaea chitinivorans]MCX7964360.1 thioredoxin [Candidatus Sumerlaea chitinivorans]RMH24497.1 MAG: thioredoxin [Candidatus Hydrogenedentota bacterium]GIX45085.1 MAG: thioredoxin [Candidatus Sumerlaea sp.]